MAFTVVDPVAGVRLAEYPTMTAAEVAAVVDAADHAFRSWSRGASPGERAVPLARAAQLMREHRDELADIIVREMGKSRAEAGWEVDWAVDHFAWAAENVEMLTADIPLHSDPGVRQVLRPAPLGAVLAIIPWNFPIMNVVRIVAPNLAVGNTVMVKPAPQCPESAAAVERILREAGLPDGACTTLYAEVDQIPAVIADRRVVGVSITGSRRAGMSVAETAGRHLTRVSLELGGSDPFVLLSTDDMDGLIEGAFWMRNFNSGQVCCAAKRFIVMDDLYEEFLAALVSRMRGCVTGPPDAEGVEVCGLSSLVAAERLQAQVDRAVEQGARVVCGGGRQGTFYEPTVLVDVAPGTAAYEEELFGPVAVVHRVADEAAAIAVANDTPYGLGARVFTTDLAQGERVADLLESGMVAINADLGGGPGVPFGGIKDSGSGRIGGIVGAHEFVNLKVLSIAS
ncbi:aldehyde dehydrogenase family protein [Demequina sp. SYSU T00192]|uniref:Aldehyde dehydrogenase family protein n=1 Tax=Demequina litoralis TaxID=3051660 RepID=A0ABT8GBX4_9MICO|nr:aldehyde dehydrogenase family protein [Demequina sp. SYSU T00192]MDN4476633.1 aldehyde dehydrogenase family protein [Demequina sp. SYSU T00192]